jgi:hypothetical protein
MATRKTWTRYFPTDPKEFCEQCGEPLRNKQLDKFETIKGERWCPRCLKKRKAAKERKP